MGRIIPYIMENKTFSKPPTSNSCSNYLAKETFQFCRLTGTLTQVNRTKTPGCDASIHPQSSAFSTKCSTAATQGLDPVRVLWVKPQGGKSEKNICSKGWELCFHVSQRMRSHMRRGILLEPPNAPTADPEIKTNEHCYWEFPFPEPIISIFYGVTWPHLGLTNPSLRFIPNKCKHRPGSLDITRAYGLPVYIDSMDAPLLFTDNHLMPMSLSLEIHHWRLAPWTGDRWLDNHDPNSVVSDRRVCAILCPVAEWWWHCRIRYHWLSKAKPSGDEVHPPKKTTMNHRMVHLGYIWISYMTNN